VLEKGLKRLPDAAALHHALGLWYVRAKMPAKALASLEKAAGLAPDDARYQYVYAVALAGTDTAAAIRVLEASLKRHSGDIDTLAALAYYHAQLGHTMQANLYRQRAERLQRFTPRLSP
jgi:predicted Zn-dependent protease